MLALLLLACDPLSDVRAREARWGSAATLAEGGLRLAEVPAGEQIPNGPRVSLWKDRAEVDNRRWLLSLPEASADPDQLRLLLREVAVTLPSRAGESRVELGLVPPLLEALETERRWSDLGGAGGEGARTVVIAPDADAPAALITRAIYEMGMAGGGSYQLVGRSGDRPVGVLASRAGRLGSESCLGEALLVVGAAESQLVLTGGGAWSEAGGRCVSLGEPAPGRFAGAVEGLARACAPRWAAATALHPERTPEGDPCLAVLWGPSGGGDLRAGALISALGAVYGVGEPVVFGPAVWLPSGFGGCAATLESLPEAALDATCGADLSGQGTRWGLLKGLLEREPPRGDDAGGVQDIFDSDLDNELLRALSGSSRGAPAAPGSSP